MKTFSAEYRVYGRLAVRITCIVVAESFHVAMQLIMARYPNSTVLEWSLDELDRKSRHVIETSNSENEL